MIYTCPMHPEIREPAPGSCPKCGMALEPVEVAADSEPNPEYADMLRRLWVSLPLAVATFVLAMGEMIAGDPLARWLSPATRVYLQAASSTPVALWAAWPFYRRALASVVRRSLNMFTLIGLGVALAYGYSLFATLAPGLLPPAFKNHAGAVPVYFEAAAVITVLVLLGQVLELKARSQTGEAIRRLLGLAAKRARRLRPDGTEEDVDLGDVRIGDRLRVRPGE
ncbi:MAG TPA: heavy metal-binding domain-containing protein, partial [Candidatus Polarisedimenticolaceae bacterium]|nr:heavy metal-binding domain-containing protein [Candidatus Polarisedimenticolaceae bacterium]